MHYFLGFDDSCIFCTILATQIQEIAGSKLDILALQSVESTQWTQNIYGKPVYDKPILFAVSENQVKAYTGLSLTLKLMQLLGPIKGVKVVALVGELNKSLLSDETGFDRKRRQFVRNLAGGFISTLLIALGKSQLATSVSAQTPSVTYSVDLSDTATSARVVALPPNNPSFLKLQKYLVDNGFVKDGTPTNITVRKNAQVLRNCFFQQYKATSGETAFIEFAEESTGFQWSVIVMYKGTNPTNVLRLVNDKIENVDVSSVVQPKTLPLQTNGEGVIDGEFLMGKAIPVDPWAAACAICGALVVSCRLACKIPLGQFLACAGICALSRNPKCLVVCQQIRTRVCPFCTTQGASQICKPFCLQ